MNREAKFRAWMPIDNDKSVWAMDYDVLLYRGKPSYVGDNGKIKHFDDAILMQYTGSKDKSNKEIYEGDILFYKKEHNPLFGHKSGKRSNTHWITFIK